MRRFLSFFLACCLFCFPFSVSAMTYAEYLADLGYSQDEIDEIIAEGIVIDDSEDEKSSTFYIDNSRVLDSGATVEVDSLVVQADTVLMSVPEDNVYPAGAPLSGGIYMQVDTVQLGEVMIYVPVSAQFKSFAFAANTETPVNITSSTISGYSYSSQDYTVRWTSFGRAQYRPVDGSYSYSDLDIVSVLNTNIVFIESPDDLPVVPDTNTLQLIIVFLLGVVIVCLFMKRL